MGLAKHSLDGLRLRKGVVWIAGRCRIKSERTKKLMTTTPQPPLSHPTLSILSRILRQVQIQGRIDSRAPPTSAWRDGRSQSPSARHAAHGVAIAVHTYFIPKLKHRSVQPCPSQRNLSS